MIIIIVFMIIWVVAETVILDAFIENIEKCEDAGNRVIAYILVGMCAPFMLIAGAVLKILEGMEIEVEEDE